MWDRIEPLMPADPVRGRRWADHRRTLEAIAWKYRTCSPWRDLPDVLGSFQTAHKRLIRWAVDGTWERILAAVLTAAEGADDIGWTVSVDSTSAELTSTPPGPGKGAPGRAEPGDHALGRSRGGLSTKVHLASDSRARPLALRVTAGQAGDARPSKPSWPQSVFRGADREDREPDPMPSWRTARTHPARSGTTSADAESALSSPSPPTKSATVYGEAVQAADRPLSTRRRTSSATRSNGASTGSSSGAAWPCERTSLPSPTMPHSTSPPSSSGHEADHRDGTQPERSSACHPDSLVRQA